MQALQTAGALDVERLRAMRQQHIVSLSPDKHIVSLSPYKLKFAGFLAVECALVSRYYAAS